jgi:hypothetical protein
VKRFTFSLCVSVSVIVIVTKLIVVDDRQADAHPISSARKQLWIVHISVFSCCFLDLFFCRVY